MILARMKITAYLKPHYFSYVLTLLLSEFTTIILSATAPDSSAILLHGQGGGTPVLFADERLKDDAFTNLNIETDSLGKDTVNRSVSQGGFGGGICLKGSLFGFHFTHIYLNNWGWSSRYYWNIYKSINVPSDYYSDGQRVFAPKDYANTLSFNLLKAFPTRKITSRLSIEAGPALVIYRQAEFELNPSYDPEYSDGYWGGSIYLYEKSHPRKFTIGGTLMAKYEYLPSKSAGFEFGLFTNINSFHTIVGLEVSFIFGHVKK